MARGNAEFAQMQPLSVEVREDIPEHEGEKADMNLDEGMEVKAFSNPGFAVAMQARNKARSWKAVSKPKAPVQPYQGKPNVQMNPGVQRMSTPPAQPVGGRKPNTGIKPKGYNSGFLMHQISQGDD